MGWGWLLGVFIGGRGKVYEKLRMWVEDREVEGEDRCEGGGGDDVVWGCNVI